GVVLWMKAVGGDQQMAAGSGAGTALPGQRWGRGGPWAPGREEAETISDNCVVIFSKTTCGYCKMAKKLFQDMNVNYTAIELDMYENGSQFQDILHQMTGGRTVPRVFINGAFIGGATDTQKLHQEGKLLPLVHQCQMRTAKNSDLPCSLP
uniref:Glutaredoxin-2, mitochondrial n=1 Tax=Chrysemys picta bellii TaxID=8478 RepID=A0A8C3FZT4_CHRPI